MARKKKSSTGSNEAPSPASSPTKSSHPTSASDRRRVSGKRVAEDDEDDTEATPATSASEKQLPLRRSTPPQHNAPPALLTPIFSAISALISSFISPFISPIVWLCILLGLVYGLLSLCSNFLSALQLPSILRLIPHPSLSTLTEPAYKLVPLISSAVTWSYCHSIGLGCIDVSNFDNSNDAGLLNIRVGRIAKKVTTDAIMAKDIFDSVISLSEPSALGLHQTEIWELAIAIKVASALPEKEILGSQLLELGDLTRDVKDQVISINSLGITSFGFLLHSFSKVSLHINNIISSSPTHSPARSQLLQENLDKLIAEFARTLSELQALVELTIPIATRASDLGRRLEQEFASEMVSLQTQRDERPPWMRAIDKVEQFAVGKKKGTASFKFDQINKDLKLTQSSMNRISSLKNGLEDLRTSLVQYRENVGRYKAGVVGTYLGGDQFSDREEMELETGKDVVEIEMEALADIMNQFEGALGEAKMRGRRRYVGEGGTRLEISG